MVQLGLVSNVSLFCMAGENNFPHAYLVEHFKCTFYLVVQYLSLAYPRVAGRL